MTKNSCFLLAISSGVFTILLSCSTTRSEKHPEADATFRRLNQLSGILNGIRDDSECADFVAALRNGDTNKIRHIAEEAGFGADVSEHDFNDSWKDGWGTEVRVVASKDFSVIVLCSYGPDRKFSYYSGDDIVFVTERGGTMSRTRQNQ